MVISSRAGFVRVVGFSRMIIDHGEGVLLSTTICTQSMRANINGW